jgi:hypothetical protein
MDIIRFGKLPSKAGGLKQKCVNCGTKVSLQ